MADVVYLDALDVISLHPAELEHGGGMPGLRDAAALEAAVARPRMATFYEERDLVDQGVLLLPGLSLAHPFVDGNKRVALLVTLTSWEMNGLTLRGNARELAEQIVAFIAAPDDRSERLSRLEAWARAHLVSVRDP